MSTQVRFTVSDLELMPEVEGTRYELIDGELHVTTQPHWRHQHVSTELAHAIRGWDDAAQVGITVFAPGVLFSQDEAVAPDVVWVTRERAEEVFDDDGKIHGAPDLMIEVLSPGSKNMRRDQELKLKIYSVRGVQEYWIVDWRERSVLVYRRELAALRLVSTLRNEDQLTSPLLPGFSYHLASLWKSPLQR